MVLTLAVDARETGLVWLLVLEPVVFDRPLIGRPFMATMGNERCVAHCRPEQI